MWDNPRLLNSAAGFLAAAALAAALYGGAPLVLRSGLFPLREVRVQGALAHTSRAEVEAATRGRVAGSFFAVELAEVRAALERLPWVRRVEVRRVWPDRLEVTLEEHVALARWGRVGDDLRPSALVNTHGERFAGRSEARLPLLAGPDGTEAEMARRLESFGALVAPLGETVERVVLSPRFAWQLGLSGGLEIVLGRDGPQPVEARLARFAAAWPQARDATPGPHSHVDLRYPNGFALRLGAGKG